MFKNFISQGIVDQTINARTTGAVQKDHNKWARQPSTSHTLQSVGESAALTVGLENGTRIYPGTVIIRDFVPPYYQSWDVVYLAYNPPSYSQETDPKSNGGSTGMFPIHILYSSVLKITLFSFATTSRSNILQSDFNYEIRGKCLLLSINFLFYVCKISLYWIADIFICIKSHIFVINCD
jgi:hypothetical protein